MALYDGREQYIHEKNKEEYEDLIESLRQDIKNIGVLTHIRKLEDERKFLEEENLRFRSALSGLASILNPYISQDSIVFGGNFGGHGTVNSPLTVIGMSKRNE